MYFVIEYFWMFNTLKMAAEKLNNPCIRISRLLSWMTTSCFHSKTPTETCWCPLDGHQDTIWPIKTLSEHLFPAYKRSHRIEFRPGLFSILFSFYPSDSRLYAFNGFTWHLMGYPLNQGKCPLDGGWAGVCYYWPTNKRFFFYSDSDSAAVNISSS